LTREIFDSIAPGWYNFRHRTIFRTELETMAERWQQGSLLNAGCGHGPDFLPFIRKFDLYGVDFSIEMLRLARRYALKFDFPANLFLADVRSLPFAGETFDWAISIATYHHIRGRENRLAALNELKRVMKPGGEAFITVWNHWQPRFWLTSSEAAVPWRARDVTLYRYYHLFSYPEMERLVKRAGFEILKSFPENSYRLPVKFFSRNICLLVRKSDNRDVTK
jgi:tRNA (uracil-5-)-methyltransferase TRM9